MGTSASTELGEPGCSSLPHEERRSLCIWVAALICPFTSASCLFLGALGWGALLKLRCAALSGSGWVVLRISVELMLRGGLCRYLLPHPAVSAALILASAVPRVLGQVPRCGAQTWGVEPQFCCEDAQMASRAHLETLKECPPRGVGDMSLEDRGTHGLHTFTSPVTSFYVLDENWGTSSDFRRGSPQKPKAPAIAMVAGSPLP